MLAKVSDTMPRVHSAEPIDVHKTQEQKLGCLEVWRLIRKMIGPAGIQTGYAICLFGFYQPIGKNLIIILRHP